MVDLLMALERQDTFPAADAVERVMNDNPPEGWSEQALSVIWQGFDADAQLNGWADMRLDHWHALKSNALRSAWENDPGAQVEHKSRCDTMLRAILLDLRAGLERHPELLSDALALQSMALAGHAFSWSQAYRELKEEQPGFDLEGNSPDLILYCQLGTYAFRWLTGGEVGS